MSVPTIAAKAAKAAVGAKAGGGKAKTRPYSGGSRTNIRLPHEPAPAPDPVPARAPDGAAPAPPGDGQPEAAPAPSGGRTLPSLPPRAGSVARDGSGVVLGFLLWVWVVLPYLNGGTGQVKRVLAAKFINQTS